MNTAPHTPKKQILLVNGLGGAGKTLALKTLEDQGYATIDNMPLRLVPVLLGDPDALPARLALGVDVRNTDIGTHFEGAMEALRSHTEMDVHVLFLTADDSVLVRRYSETRRTHPLAGKGRPIAESVALERSVLAPVHAQADTVLDTSRFKPGDLQRYIKAQFGAGGGEHMSVFLMSFGFKHGIPPEADMVFDVRFLRNPHWEDDLRPKTGQTKEVADYVRQDPSFDGQIAHLETWLREQIPLHDKGGKSYLTVAIGCTGGKHRSVMVAEELMKRFADIEYPISLHHRDMPTS